MMKVFSGIGSRETPEDIGVLMGKIAKKLESEGWTLRSGGAPGADTFFDVVERKEIYLPWAGFQDLKGKGYIDASKLPTAKQAEEITSGFHPNWEKLTQGGKRLMSRNAMQILGADLKTPTKYVIAWTKDGGATGGTGQALRMAAHYNIPIFNLFFKEVQERFENYIK